MLVLLILAIGLSPRLRLGYLAGKAIDLRVQDLLLVVALGLLLLGPRPDCRRGSRGLPDQSVLWFVLVAGLSSVFGLALTDGSVVRAIANFGRAVEAFILALVIWRLYVRSGDSGRRLSVGSIVVTIMANCVWVLVQVLTGTPRTVIGDVPSVKYGPVLVGEPSAYGAGVFFTFAAVFGVAAYWEEWLPRVWSAGLVGLSLAAAWLVGSRINIAAAVLVAVVFAAVKARARRPDWVRAGLVLATVVLVVAAAQPTLTGRLAPAAVQSSLGIRTDGIWRPLLDIAVAHAWTGIGPGSLGTSAYPWTEAHDIYLRAWLDYGFFGAVAFFAVFVVAVARSWRALRSAEAGRVRGWDLMVVLFLPGVALTGVLQDTFTVVTSTHLMMLVVGLATGAAVLHDQEGTPGPSTMADRKGRPADLAQQTRAES